MPEATIGARSVSPSASVTPIAWPPLDVDRGDRRVRAHDGAVGARGARDGLRDRAHAALDLAPGADLAVDLADAMVEQVVGGARRARAGPDADDAARGEGAEDGVGLEAVLEEVGDRGGHEAVRVGQVAAAQAQGAGGKGEAAAGVAGRRIHEQQRADHAGDALERLLVLVVRDGVTGGDARDLAARAPGVGLPEDDRCAVLGDGAPARIADADAVAVAHQLELAHELGVQQAHDVRAAGDAVAGPDLLGDAGAAEHAAALEHADVLAGPRQVGGAVRPLWPPPTTIASKSSTDIRLPSWYKCTVHAYHRSRQAASRGSPARDPGRDAADRARRRRRRGDASRRGGRGRCTPRGHDVLLREQGRPARSGAQPGRRAEHGGAGRARGRRRRAHPRRADVADALVALSVEQLESATSPLVAQYELYLEAARRPSLRGAVARWERLRGPRRGAAAGRGGAGAAAAATIVGLGARGPPDRAARESRARRSPPRC